MEVVRRSTRLKTSRVTFTPTKTISKGKTCRNTTMATDGKSIHSVNYKLDKSKAIKKQRDATERPYHIDIKNTKGNIVLTFTCCIS